MNSVAVVPLIRTSRPNSEQGAADTEGPASLLWKPIRLACRSGKHTDHTKRGVHETRDASWLPEPGPSPVRRCPTCGKLPPPSYLCRRR